MQLASTQLKRCDLVKASGNIDSDTSPQLATAFQAITDGTFTVGDFALFVSYLWFTTALPLIGPLRSA